MLRVRAAMAVRAHGLAQGYSGVDPSTVDVLIAMLNHGLHPIVRQVGSVGASGDLVELAQIARAVIGEGTVEYAGRTISAAAAFRAIGVTPLAPRYREGLALMNGTSFHTGAAAVLCAHSARGEHVDRVPRRGEIGGRRVQLVLTQARFSELDRVLVAVGDRHVDQRVDGRCAA